MKTSEQLSWLIRRHAVEMTHISHASHIGSIMSVADILGVLYADVLKYHADNPKWEERDRLIFSKGHASAALYSVLAESDFFEVDELKTHYENGSRLSGHVSHLVPGIDFSAGSLGHGLSVASGIAYVAKKDGKAFKTFVVMGDGECNEGSVWEAALFANHFRLNNLVAIIDYNHMQSLDFNENTIELNNLASKWAAFGWNVIEVDGNNHEELRGAFNKAEIIDKVEPHKPTVIIAHTIKGFGVSFMQNDILWHYRFPHDGWEYDCAVTELFSKKPCDIEDPYTPNGIENIHIPTELDDINNDHTFSATWNPSYPEPMHRVTAKSGSCQAVYNIGEKNERCFCQNAIVTCKRG